MDRKIFRAARVNAPRQQSMIGRMLGAADLEKGLPLPERVAVEQDLFGLAIARAPAHDLMLATDAVARIIVERPIRPGNLSVVFLDAAAQFPQQTRLQIARRRE